MPPTNSSTLGDSQDSTTTTTSSHGWVEIRSAGAMGNGLFAVKDIPRGARIIAEPPILRIPTSSQDHQDLPAFCNALHQLPKAEWKDLDQLFCNQSHITPVTRDKIRQWYRDQGITDSDGEVLKGKKLQDVSKATIKRFAIFLTNRVEMGVGGKYGSGVFSLYSRINHSCVPNAHNSYNPSIGRLTVHAIRDIRKDEQITVGYINSACRTLQQRKAEIAPWGFTCNCLACTDPSIDRMKKRMLELDQRLAIFDSPLRQMMAGFNPSLFARMPPPPMPKTANEALQEAEELASLLKEQGLDGMDLCKTYRDCSKFSLELGDTAKALEYARKELDIERCIIGTETAHLRDDMYGADYWLAHLTQLAKSKQYLA